MNKPTTYSLMCCDGCGLTDDTLKPNITAQEIRDDPEAALMSVKTYFQDMGWYVSLGYDLCPNCREEKGL